MKCYNNVLNLNFYNNVNKNKSDYTINILNLYLQTRTLLHSMQQVMLKVYNGHMREIMLCMLEILVWL